jgi:hypothetical protein
VFRFKVIRDIVVKRVIELVRLESELETPTAVREINRILEVLTMCGYLIVRTDVRDQNEFIDSEVGQEDGGREDDSLRDSST